MRARLAVFFALVTSAVAAQAEIAPISPGSPAPAMAVSHWLKGEPVDKLDPHKTYVVEFWATWCGPCLESIPHVTELAKANSDVTFVGISIWEDWDSVALPKFVAKQGDKMNYHIGYSGNKEGMAATWMDAASQNGIPTAFVIKDGKVMWVGHPMALDKPLAEIKAGTFDLATYRAVFEKRAERHRRMMAAFTAIGAAQKRFDSGDHAGAKADLDKAAVDYPEQADSIEQTRFDWLAVINPNAWTGKAKAMATSGKDPDLQTLRIYALHNAKEPKRLASAKTAMSLVLAAKPNDYDTLLYAYNFYKQIKDDRAELKAINGLLASATPNEEFRSALAARKKEIQKGLTTGGRT